MEISTKKDVHPKGLQQERTRYPTEVINIPTRSLLEKHSTWLNIVLLYINEILTHNHQRHHNSQQEIIVGML
jgi:hypothetical protein